MVEIMDNVPRVMLNLDWSWGSVRAPMRLHGSMFGRWQVKRGTISNVCCRNCRLGSHWHEWIGLGLFRFMCSPGRKNACVHVWNAWCGCMDSLYGNSWWANLANMFIFRSSLADMMWYGLCGLKGRRWLCIWHNGSCVAPLDRKFPKTTTPTVTVHELSCDYEAPNRRASRSRGHCRTVFVVYVDVYMHK